VRGSCLSHPDVLAALRGFIVTSWSGHTDQRNPQGMPPDVARIHAAAEGTRVRGNIKCFLLTPEGEVEAVFNAFPNNDVTTFGFNPDEAGRHFARSVRQFSKGMKIPEPSKDTSQLSLPRTLPDGSAADARMLLHISPRSQPSQYLAAVAEPLRLGEAARGALVTREGPQTGDATVEARSLSSILTLFYPPAIMQKSGQIKTVSGNLKRSPLGTDDNGAWAKLTGTATLTLDDGADSRFPVQVDALVCTDPSSGTFKSVRGILRGVCPKVPFDNGRGRTHHLEMTATFATLDPESE
jgi:hypothetical protein